MNSDKKSRLIGNILLLTASFIWGAAFVAQKIGAENIGPFSFNGVRILLGALVVLPFVLLQGRRGRGEAGAAGVAGSAHKDAAAGRKALLRGGLFSGFWLFLGCNLQQIGLMFTSAGKSGFLTALYIILVPLLSIALGKKIGRAVWVGVALAVGGMYLLCVPPHSAGEFAAWNVGDLCLILCALCFALQIMTIDRYLEKADGLQLSCLQFFVAGLLSLICMFFFERPVTAAPFLAAWLPICYAGILSTGVGFTLQILGQKRTEPAIASLLMSMESVWALVSGMILLRERMRGGELLGCVLMFAAIILAQLPDRGKQK